jgi:hypothetical protein
MESAALPQADGPAAGSGFMPWVWSLLVLGLVFGHGWKTLQLFGPDDPWHNLLDERPLLDGRHPLHLYHGYLGARSFRSTWRSTCYDPAFQAGYPKTPIFDSGSRPAELFLLCAGAEYDPAAYKIGLAICCALVPVLIIIACWGAGLSPAATFLATASAILVWWSTAGRRALDAGDLDLLMAALAVLAHVGLLLRFDRQPGLLTWMGMLLTGCMGWFAHPVLFPLVLPLLLAYYVTVGVRHSLLTWHLALGLSELGALALNSFWLVDWLQHWWLRSPLPYNEALLLHRTFATIWAAPQWGDLADRVLAAILLVSGLLGVAIFNQVHQRVTARLLGLGTAGLWAMAILGIAWEPLGRIGTSDLMVPALWFAALPAAHAWTQLFRLGAHLLGSTWRAAGVVVTALGVGIFAGRDLVEPTVERCRQTPYFTVGLSPERQALVQALKYNTTPDARILWEDQPNRPGDSTWTALLPHWTGRNYMGGLVPNGEIEHANAGLIDQTLRGRPLPLWSDGDLEVYCRRYNIGWIACRSPQSAARFRSWNGAIETALWQDDGPVWFFTVRKPAMSYAIKGKARVLHMDSHHIILADVVPEDGAVVLSLHYQTGLHATPERVVLEREPDAADLIPFLRLRLDQPVARVTITWRER